MRSAGSYTDRIYTSVHIAMKMTMNNILVGLSIVAVIGGWGISFGKLFEKQNKTEEKVVEVKAEVKEVEKEVDANEDKAIQHAVILERVVQQLERLEEK